MLRLIFKKIIEVNYASFIWYVITAIAVITIDKISGGIISEAGFKTKYILGFIGASSSLLIVNYLPNIKFSTFKFNQELTTILLLITAGGLVFFQQSSVHSLFAILNQSGFSLIFIWIIFIVLYLFVIKVVIDERQ